jgi:hypothetical protein
VQHAAAVALLTCELCLMASFGIYFDIHLIGDRRPAPYLVNVVICHRDTPTSIAMLFEIVFQKDSAFAARSFFQLLGGFFSQPCQRTFSKST